MEIKLPDGCNLYYGSYFDNYNNGLRQRFYFDDGGNFIPVQRQTYTSIPHNSVCYDGIVLFKPELEIEFKFFSVCLILFVFMVLYQLLFKKLWMGR